MSLEGLKKFNAGYGFPFHKEARDKGKRGDIKFKLFLTVPFLSIILTKGKIPLKEEPACCSRTILASTIVGLPIVFALDIIATLFTQPIGRALEKRRVRNLQQQ